MREDEKTYLALLFIEFVVTAGETLHGDKKVSQGRLEFGPVIARIEQLPDEGLNLHFVEIGE